MNARKFILPGLILTLMAAGCTKTTVTTDTESGNWIRRSSFEGVARSEAISLVVADSAYIGTGYDGTKRLKDFWKYDPVLNYWTQKAEFPGAARNSAVAFAIDGKGYVGTGYDGVNKVKDFYQYDPATNVWAKKTDFGGSARYDAVGFAVMNQGYISTGFDGNYLKDLWQYDAVKDLWSQQVSMGGDKRSGAVAFVYNNKAYITSGANNGVTVTDLWAFDPSAGTWTEKRKIANLSTDTYDDAYSIVRTNAVAFVMGDKAYVATGENGSLLKSAWMYDFSTDLWSVKSDFEGVARTGAVGFSVSNRGYISTGSNNTYWFDDIYEWKPDETLDTND